MDLLSWLGLGWGGKGLFVNLTKSEIVGGGYYDIAYVGGSQELIVLHFRNSRAH